VVPANGQKPDAEMTSANGIDNRQPHHPYHINRPVHGPPDPG